MLLAGSDVYITERYNQNKSRSQLNRVIDYIHASYNQDLSLKMLADIACLSRFHFHRKFHNLLGETPNEFIRRYRLENATHKLMLNQYQSITDLALECGFSSSQSFSRSYKAHFGITPTIVRDCLSWNGMVAKLKKAQKGRLSPKELLFVEAFLKKRGVTLQDFLKKEYIDVDVQHLPPKRVAYIRTIGSYAYADYKPALRQLVEWALPKHYINKNTFLQGVAWNNTDLTPKEKLIYDVCIEVPKNVKADKYINIQTLPGGLYAVYHAEADTKSYESQAEYTKLMKWLMMSDYRPLNMPSYNIYLNRARLHPLGHAIIDICAPVTPVTK